MSSEQELVDVPVYARSEASGYSDSNDAGGYDGDEDGGHGQPGMGLSKSSRRRRRKRKGKGPEGAVGVAEGGVIAAVQAGAEAPVSAPSQPTAAHTGGRHSRSSGQQNAGQQSQQQNGQNGQNAPGGTKRWKKKNFRDRDGRRGDGGSQQSHSNNGGGGHQQSAPIFRGPDTHQPGNSAVGFGKRKGGYGKQQNNGGGGSRGFVGPMDHSYRVANGNVFDIPSATIDAYGNGGGGSYGGRPRSYAGDSQPIDYSQGRVIPIAEGTPTKIYFFIEDLFFTAKIQETARKLGVKVGFIKNEKDQIAALTESEDGEKPGLIVFDLNNANAKPLTLIPKLKSKLKKQTSIIGFLSHLQGDLKAKAVEAGCDTVMPRAAFSQNLPNLLRRYGIEEVDEPNFNQ